jgi:hypothetical protein
MSWPGSPLPVRINDAFGNPASLDAFGRQRVSQPFTVFDSKQVFTDQSLVFDTSLVGGATSVYNPLRASTVLTASGAGQTAIRQTRRYFNYQPGKSQFIFMTFVMNSGNLAGVTKRAGYFDADNGFFIDLDGVDIGFVRRSNVTGAPVNTRVAQASWNLDRLDGLGGATNPSGINLDISQSQIFFIAFEWLGTGSATLGFVIAGKFVPAHRFDNANLAAVVYMRTPNLPLRYEVSSTGGNSSVEAICCSVQSEGGQDPVGQVRSADRALATKTISSANMELVIAIRLSTVAPANRATVIPRAFSILTPSTANTRWALILYSATNFAAQVGGASVFQTIAQSSVEFDVNLTAVGSRVINLAANGRPVNGFLLQSGYFSDNQSEIFGLLESVLSLASDIAGAPDVLVMGAQPVTGANESYLGGLSWFEAQ